MGAAQCTALGKRRTDEHQVKDLGCPGQGCADSAPVCSMRPREGFHKAVLCLTRGLLEVICHHNSTQQGAKPGDPCEVRESLATRGQF